MIQNIMDDRHVTACSAERACISNVKNSQHNTDATAFVALGSKTDRRLYPLHLSQLHEVSDLSGVDACFSEKHHYEHLYRRHVCIVYSGGRVGRVGDDTLGDNV